MSHTPRCFGVPMHTVHVETEYPVGVDKTYIRHYSIVWVDEGLDKLQRHTYLAWFYCEGLETIGPICGLEGQQHGGEDAMDWEPADKYASDGEVIDPKDPPEDLSPEPEPLVPDLVLEPE